MAGSAFLVLTLLAALLCLPCTRGLAVVSLIDLHSFSGSDGTFPLAALVQGSDGNFYGTTEEGGTSNAGTVFKITPAGVLTTLYSFTGGTDGGYPSAALVQGSDGNFYGTTENGGTSRGSAGTVFRVTPAGVYTLLYSFTGGSDGANPDAGLVQGSDGNFYGTTSSDGTGFGGTIFQVTPAGALTTLYSFGVDDGSINYAALVQGSDGNFYGTINGGGANGYGMVFQITPTGVLTTLYSFTGGSDGGFPEAALVQGSDGNFYGTTYGEGASGYGTVFQITPTGVLTTLYSFTGGSDGFGPYGGLVQGSDGNFYGRISGGGTTYTGTVFQLTPAGAFTIVFTFSGGNGRNVGDLPNSSLLLGSDGSLYGTSEGGGAYDQGTVFRLTLAADMAGPGTVALGAASTTTVENAGSVVLPVVRTAGDTGSVSVDYATEDVSALAGTDYQPVSGTLTWADGDSSPKYITVPLIDRGLTTGGSVLFAVDLGNPGGGAALGSPVQEAVTIIDTESAVGDLLTTSLLSPPNGVTLTQNVPVSVQADVEALSDTLANVEFYAVDSSGNSTNLGGTTSPRGQITWQPAAAGDFTLAVVATDVQGNTQYATSLAHVLPAADVGAVPQASLFGGLDGTTVALNDTVDVVAQATDSDGNALANVQFYLDGVPIATTTDPTDIVRAGARRAAVATGTVSRASVLLSKVQQTLTAVGTKANGVSAVSNSATLYGELNAGTPPAVSIGNFNDGDSVTAGDAGQSVTVAVSAGSLPIDHVDLYVDSTSVGTATAAPFTFSLPMLPAGPHALIAKATDKSLLSKVSEPVVVKAEATYSLPAFFSGQATLGSGAYYLAFSTGNYFGYYSFLSDPHYIYHFDLGYEYVFDAQDGKAGVYFYDFASSTFFYTSPTFPFPYLYDFTLNTVLYYYPDPNNPGHYNTDGYRFFYDFATNSIIVK